MSVITAPPGGPKTKPVNIRLAPEELANLRAAAKACGVKPATLLRTLAATVRVSRPHQGAQITLAQEVARQIN